MSLRRDNEFHSFVVRTASSAEPAHPSPEPTVTATGWTLLAIAGMRWLRAQRTRVWWRVLVVGVVVLGAAWLAMVSERLSWMVPIYALAFGALLPVTAAVAWLEQGTNSAEVDRDLLLAVLCGLVAGVASAFALYSGWLKLNILTWQGAAALAVGEELLKTLAVVYFLWSPRARGVREGIRIGVGAALGFTVTQMALASYLAFHATVSGAPQLAATLFRPGIANMDHMLAFQLALQALGEVVWTALICAAVWRERGGRRLGVTPGLIAIVLAVLVLHAVFNYTFLNGWLELRLGGVYLPLVSLVVAVASYGLLRFFVAEIHEQEALGALPPSSLLPALGTYAGERRGRMRRWYTGVATAAQGTPVTAPGTSMKPGDAPPNPPEPPESRSPTDTGWLV